MKKQSFNLSLTLTLTLSMICAASFSSLAAENPPARGNQAIPKGCVKLEDEIKFSGKNVYFSDLGHLTAGKLEVAQLSSVDPKAADVIRTDEITDLKDDSTTLTKGEVTLESATLADQPAPVKFDNEPFNPRTAITIQIQRLDNNEANISGSIKLKPAEVALIKLKNMNVKALDAPYVVCGVGMQLYLSAGKKKIDHGTLVLYVHQGADKTIAIEALNNGRNAKPAGHVNTEIVAEPDSKGLDSAGRAL
jgi:hypothetical protein